MPVFVSEYKQERAGRALPASCPLSRRTRLHEHLCWHPHLIALAVAPAATTAAVAR